MEPGIYYNIPFDEYHSWEAFSKSKISYIMRSAMHLALYNETEIAPTDAMILGSIVDAMLLEPEELNKFPVLSDTYDDIKINKETCEIITTTKPWNGNSTICKEEKAGYIKAGKTPVHSKTMQQAQHVVDGVNRNNAAIDMINRSTKQVALVWEDCATGILCKGRLDGVIPGEKLFDLKTTNDASYEEFSKKIVNMGYGIQAAMYSEAWAILNGGEWIPFDIIVAETTAPYCSVVRKLRKNTIEAGKIWFNIAIERYSEMLKHDPNFEKGYENGLIDIPDWAYRQAKFAEDRYLENLND
jgi:hypothetical protein